MLIKKITLSLIFIAVPLSMAFAQNVLVPQDRPKPVAPEAAPATSQAQTPPPTPGSAPPPQASSALMTPIPSPSKPLAVGGQDRYFTPDEQNQLIAQTQQNLKALQQAASTAQTPDYQKATNMNSTAATQYTNLYNQEISQLQKTLSALQAGPVKMSDYYKSFK